MSLTHSVLSIKLNVFTYPILEVWVQGLKNS